MKFAPEAVKSGTKVMLDEDMAEERPSEMRGADARGTPIKVAYEIVASTGKV